MIMENSGIRQASEPIARFSFRSAIPMVMVLSYRGDFGERNFSGHNHAQTVAPMLNVLRIPFRYVEQLENKTIHGGALHN
jgi:sulfopyruvate decarboxylase subunit alpha